jgi:GNAT superfamily N-acetyltransferase
VGAALAELARRLPQGHDVTTARGEYEISTDPARLDRAAVARFLREEAYWSTGIPAAVVERAIDGSLVFGLYRSTEQVGFARVVTDRATFAWLADVFVVAPHRGRGLGRWLVETVLAHPDLAGLRRVLLATEDAHTLYERHGFRRLDDAQAARFMTIEHDPADVYGDTPE